MEKNKNKSVKSSNIMLIVIFCSILLTVVITVAGMTYYKDKIDDIRLIDSTNERSYSKHYALIIKDSDSTFGESIYEGAKMKGKQLDIYVENFESNLPFSYSVNERMNMAIVAKVDGIIVEGNGDAETTEIINQAVESGIPVITIIEDAPQSKRTCFVGVNSYQIGKEYGQQILDVTGNKSKNVMVLLDSSSEDLGPDIVLSGIKDTLKDSKVKVSVITIDKHSAFSSEEAIHKIIMDYESTPDVLVCLNEVDTISAYQALVDYNKVGEIEMIGYYNSEAIQLAIKNNIIHSTIVIDTEQMGENSVEALYEYSQTRRVSEFISVDMNLIGEGD